MLNRLKNSEIHLFFEEALQKKESGFAWIDLWALSRALQNKEITDDQSLESMLYGNSVEPYFSGFTETRIQNILASLGSANIEISDLNQGKREGRLRTPHPSKSHSQKTFQKLSRLKFREKRKRLRKKVRELSCRIREKIRFSELPAELKLNLGAGDENHEDYLKVDWAGPQDIFDNIISLQKIPDESVSEIYSSHVLEHIPIDCIAPMLRRWHQVLKPGGIMRLRMPDAKQAVLQMGKAWEEVGEPELIALGFPNYLAKEQERSGQVSEEMAIQFIYGWSDVMPGCWDMSNQHKSLWTPKLARTRLEDAGFDVKLAQNFGTLQTIAIASKRK